VLLYINLISTVLHSTVIGPSQVLPNGNLVFPPFRAEDYRQEVHAQVYSCLARSPAGSVHSRDVNVRAGKCQSLLIKHLSFSHLSIVVSYIEDVSKIKAPLNLISINSNLISISDRNSLSMFNIKLNVYISY